jgi:hypothetical protein
MNTRSTSKRRAANCASEVNVLLDLPSTSDPGVGSEGAVPSWSRDVHDVCGEPDGERPLAEDES